MYVGDAGITDPKANRTMKTAQARNRHGLDFADWLALVLDGILGQTKKQFGTARCGQKDCILPTIGASPVGQSQRRQAAC